MKIWLEIWVEQSRALKKTLSWLGVSHSLCVANKPLNSEDSSIYDVDSEWKTKDKRESSYVQQIRESQKQEEEEKGEGDRLEEDSKPLEESQKNNWEVEIEEEKINDIRAEEQPLLDVRPKVYYRLPVQTKLITTAW